MTNSNYAAPKTTLKTVAPKVTKPATTLKKSLVTEYIEKSEQSKARKTTAVVQPEVVPLTTKTELDYMIASQLTDRQHAPLDISKLTKNVTYFTAANGIFKVTKTPVALFKTKLTSGANMVPGLPEMEEGVELLIPKIPFKVIVQALTFYRDVNTRDKCEVSSLYFWNHKNIIIPAIPGILQEGQLVTYIPIQQNSPTLSEFDADPWVDWLRTNCALLLELHSHRISNLVQR